MTSHPGASYLSYYRTLGINQFQYSIIAKCKSLYRALTCFWPPPTPLWPPCIKGGCLRLAEMGSDFTCLAHFSAKQAN